MEGKNMDEKKIKIALDTNHLHFFDKETEKTILNK